jgi:pre-60S factor REI1
MQMEDEEWDVRRSLFDGHMSGSFEVNLEYMWKKFGFYFPEAELLTDPEGLLMYLVRISCWIAVPTGLLIVGQPFN